MENGRVPRGDQKSNGCNTFDNDGSRLVPRRPVHVRMENIVVYPSFIHSFNCDGSHPPSIDKTWPPRKWNSRCLQCLINNDPDIWEKQYQDTNMCLYN